jgi:hypothetical protein
MGYQLTAKKVFNLCFTALLSLTFFASCDDEDEPFEASTYIWSPAIKVEKGDGEAKIGLSDPTIFALYVYPGPARPSHFIIFKSDDMENFSEYETVDSETTSVLIKDLVNDKPYYFFVTAHLKGFPSVNSDTLMIIPSAKFERDAYTPVPNGPFERFSVSFDETYGLYRDNHRYYQFKSSDPGQLHLVDNQTYSAKWSPKANKLVYVKNIIVESAAYPTSINIYDAESLASTILLTIPNRSYLVSSPVFTLDGNKITYLSTEGNAGELIYDLWSIDIATQEKVKLSDFGSAGFATNSPFVWNRSGEEIFLSGAYHINTGGYNVYDNGIHKFNVSTKSLTPVIVSKWGDQYPALSPNGSTIAFVSYRSGEDELWTYDLNSSKYRQITGESDDNFFSPYSEIQWLDDERLLTSVVEDNLYRLVTFHVN